MKIGIVSDTHGKTRRLKRALKALVKRQAEAIVHCGDVLDEEHVALLGEYSLPTYLVAGNMDRHLTGRLAQAAAEAGVVFAEDVLIVPLGDGRKLAVIHGNREELLAELLHGGRFAYLCHGHTHRRRDERIGATRVLNPGALHHPHGTSRRTVLLLDTSADTVEEIEL